MRNITNILTVLVPRDTSRAAYSMSRYPSRIARHRSIRTKEKPTDIILLSYLRTSGYSTGTSYPSVRRYESKIPVVKEKGAVVG